MMRLRLTAIWTGMLIGLSVYFRIVKSVQQPSSEKQIERRLLVNMTLLPHTSSSSIGAVCLDGSPPAYHLDRGVGPGSSNWLLQFEGGGWCNDLVSCLERSRTRRGSTRYMNKLEVFSGILSNDPDMNPDFYNWNRVKLRYCDGASFAGDSHYTNGTIILHFKGERIWEAIINDLLSKGLMNAKKVLLSGCSAGGLATFLHCDDLSRILPESVIVKCMSDAGFFLDVEDISGNDTISAFFHNLVNLQGVESNLNKDCLASHSFPHQCFFPQYNLPFIRTPFFILNSAFDVYQINHIFVPPSTDLSGHWDPCKSDPAACTPNQISILQGRRCIYSEGYVGNGSTLGCKPVATPIDQKSKSDVEAGKPVDREMYKILVGFRLQMLTALTSFESSRIEGMFINSCFAHCQSELQDTWFAENSPRIHNKSIAEAVGDWYFGRKITKEVGCPRPCVHTCQNLIP